MPDFSPAAMGGLRTMLTQDRVVHLNYTSVGQLLNNSYPMIDSTLVEYSMQGVMATPSATLSIGFDRYQDDGVVDVYTYNGMGVIGTWDAFIGTRFASVAAKGDHVDLNIDVTQVFNQAVASGQPYLGFRFGTSSEHTLWHGTWPTLSVDVPEPSLYHCLAFFLLISLTIKYILK
jgi:hypothetical protein